MRKYRKIFKIFILFLSLIAFAGSTACNKKTPDDVAYYTCPMHPRIQMDQPGQCPICGMSLVPKKLEDSSVETDHEGHDHDHGSAEEKETNAGAIKIDPDWTQSIGVQTTEVGFHELTEQLMVQGKVAHDPKLWVAQKEYLIALKLGDPSLIRSSEEKLLFLGLSKAWIRWIKKTGQANLGLHVPEPSRPTFFEAFINQSDIEKIRPGQRVKILDIKSRFLADGEIRALGTLVEMESRTIRALIQADKYLDLKSNTFVQLEIDKALGKRLAIPKSAVFFNGDHNMVYVESSPGRYLGKRVELGVHGDSLYEITSGLKAGERIVTNGQFLLDSETQIRMGTQGGHQH